MSKVGFIYKLAHNDPEIKEIYIGSTSNLKRRKCEHKHSCNTETDKHYNLNVYQFIRSNGGFVNWNIYQIEEVKYNTKYQLHARERHYIEQLNPSLNKNIPTRTRQEHYEENKQEIVQYKKQYYEENKQEIVQYKKQYYEENKQELLENMKQYYEENKQEINDKKKQYYEENKQEISEKANQKFNCQCGGKYTKIHKVRHNKSQKHQAYITTQSLSLSSSDELSS